METHCSGYLSDNFHFFFFFFFFHKISPRPNPAPPNNFLTPAGGGYQFMTVRRALLCTEFFIIIIASSRLDLDNVERVVKYQIIIQLPHPSPTHKTNWSLSNMSRAMRKRVFGHIRIAKVQIRLHIRAVWSGASLSANRFI